MKKPDFERLRFSEQTMRKFKHDPYCSFRGNRICSHYLCVGKNSGYFCHMYATWFCLHSWFSDLGFKEPNRVIEMKMIENQKKQAREGREKDL